jgi:hypothetical protein
LTIFLSEQSNTSYSGKIAKISEKKSPCVFKKAQGKVRCPGRQLE